MKSRIEIAEYYSKQYTPNNRNAGELIALKAMDAFAELPLQVQCYWQSYEPRKEELCLVNISHGTKDAYIVARWNTEQRCFISEETGKKIENFVCWKRIKETN